MKKIMAWFFPNNKNFDPSVSFFNLKVVRVTAALWLIIFVAFSVGCIVMLPKKYSLDISFSGLNTLIFEILKTPITFLALLIPIGAVYAANHRSSQSIKAAEIAQTQNAFSNYYKHAEEFDKYVVKFDFLEKIGRGDKLKSISSRRLHTILYGTEKKPTGYQADDKILDSVYSSAKAMRMMILQHIKPDGVSEILNVDGNYIMMSSFDAKSGVIFLNERDKIKKNILGAVSFEENFDILTLSVDHQIWPQFLLEKNRKILNGYSESILILCLLIYLSIFDDCKAPELLSKSRDLVADIFCDLGMYDIVKFIPG